jgi:6-phosphogluconolactonase (cycloisomerase 2 family)
MPVSVYAGIGATLYDYGVDVEAGVLVQRGHLRLPARVQYAWPHPTLSVLYAACADRGAAGPSFYLCALRRDATGELSLLDAPVALPSRPIHVTTDPAGQHVLTAYSGAPGLTVHGLSSDGTIGAALPYDRDFEYGTYPHQVRVMPEGGVAILVDRGRKSFGSPDYVSGALRGVRFDGGRIEPLYTVVPRHAAMMGGFNPRHLDFHRQRPLAFVSLEGQNKLCVFGIDGGQLESEPRYTRELLVNPDATQPRQDAGTVHLHPGGRVVYVANRNDGYVGGHKGPSWLTPQPVPVFPGGENNIAVFALDADGAPHLIQHADSRGLHPRTFALDPSGRLLLAGNLAPTRLRRGDMVTDVPANLAVFRVAEDGRLHFLHRHDLEVGREVLWWMGVAA